MSSDGTVAPACVKRGCEVPVNETSWGSLQWMVGRHNGASGHMTLGRVTIKPGMGNPVHQHPNCEEILLVIAGELEHTLPGGGTVRLRPGDCIVLAPGGFHRAVNVGRETAVVVVAFNSADRQTLTRDEGAEE
jgi:quercetin dioxygenase-like cupin family protein